MAAQGSKAGSHFAGQPRPPIAAGLLQRAVAAEEFGPVAGDGSSRARPRRRRRPGRQIRCCRDCARTARRVGGSISVTTCMHRFRRAGRRAPIRHSRWPRAGAIGPSRCAPCSTRELHRRIERDIDPQLGVDAVFRVFEDAVAEAVPGDIGSRAAAGQRRGRPEVAALFVADVEGLSARIGDRIVVPGRQAELVGVFAPGVGAAALGDDGAEIADSPAR